MNMFPLSSTQLQSLADEDSCSKELVQDIVVHRIANEIFANAAKGETRYSCDIVDCDIAPFIVRLFKMFPDCTIEVTGNVMPGWSGLTVKW
jgi:hypothetical protein